MNFPYETIIEIDNALSFSRDLIDSILDDASSAQPLDIEDGAILEIDKHINTAQNILCQLLDT